MTRDREFRKRSPGIIARLMGMEGLPSQQPAHKQQKKSPESYQQRTESVAPMRKNSLYEECSYRKSLKEDQEFKDVFEVVETKDVYHSRYPVQGNGSSKLTEAKMAFFRQKVMDAKRFSTDENLQVSKEFDDTLEVLDSNKDLFLECLQERNSLFSKHLHDLQNPPSQSHSRHVVARKTSESRKSGSNRIGYVADRETALKSQTSSRQRHYDGHLSGPYERGTHNSLKSSRFSLEEEDVSSTVPTRIVVLKPNFGRTQSVSKSTSPHPSYTSLSDSRMQTELPNLKGKMTELRRKKYKPDAGVSSRQKSKESREIDKNITGRMKNRLSASPLNFPSSGFNGYMGDESSCYVSGNESETESEVTTFTYRKSFDWNDWHWISSSHSPGSSSVNNEAGKRLSERWNSSHSFKEVGLAGRNSTLGEMLAISNGTAKSKKFGSINDRDRRRDSFAGIQESFERVHPIGISSKEGWRDACIESLSRSRSLPVSTAAFGSPITRKCHGILEGDRYSIANDAVNLGRTKAVTKHSDHKNGSSSRIPRYPPRKLKPFQYADSDTACSNINCQNQLKRSPVENAPSEQGIMLSEKSFGNIDDRNFPVGAVVDVEVEHKDMELLSDSSGELACIMLVRDDSSPQDSDNSASKETSNEPSGEGPVPLIDIVLEPESPSNIKAAEQPSPVSVLEIPFPNDPPSGSECFDSVSADLQGLRMQLQLLKLETEEYAEGRMAISSNEDEIEESSHIAEEAETLIAEENWESSFMADVLIRSGFGNEDPYTFMATWRSPECSIDDSIFQTLEKKYCNHSDWSRCEGKLLFDRVNSALVETCQQFTDPHQWVKSSARRIGWKESKVSLEDCLYKLLENQDTMLGMDDLTETVMKTRSQWLHLEDAIDEIGIEFEKLLIDELVREVVTV